LSYLYLFMSQKSRETIIVITRAKIKIAIFLIMNGNMKIQSIENVSLIIISDLMQNIRTFRKILSTYQSNLAGLFIK
jgi:hypothetical protein